MLASLRESVAGVPRPLHARSSALKFLLTIWLIPTHPFTLASGTLPFIPVQLLFSKSSKHVVQELSAHLSMSPHLAVSCSESKHSPYPSLFPRCLAHNEKLLRTG